MKKILFFLLLFPFIVWPSLAQHQSDIWYFGNRAGMSFSSGTPVVLYDNESMSNEGTASIADPSTGQLIMYANGVLIYDRTHNVMSGIGPWPLRGDVSAAQGVTIVPQPGSNHLYYVFTTPAQVGYYPMTYPGLYYSIVDMNLNNGNGDIMTPNVLLMDSTTEKLAVIGNCDQSEYWVLAHRWNCDSFFAYKLTSQGLSTPVVSTVGIVHRSGPNAMNIGAIGYMKFSSNGKKVGLVVCSDPNVMELFDFDFATGKLSNPIRDKIEQTYAMYGCSFSPDNSKFYTNGNGVIYQYDVNAGDSAAIIASRTTITTTCSASGAMLNGPDGKMYVAYYTNSGLGVINNPNAAGTACNLTALPLVFSPGEPVFGLPNMVEHINYGDVVAPAFQIPPLHTLCKGESIIAPQPYLSSLSIFPDSNISINSDNSQIIFSPQTTTEYTVISKGDKCAFPDTVKFTIKVDSDPFADFEFNPEQPTTNDPTILLDNGSIHAQTYKWYDSTGTLVSQDTNYRIANPGAGHFCYALVAFDSLHCTDTAKVCITIVEHLKSSVFIPNAFSPNGDGLNDEFKINGINIKLESFSVFDRYGEKVFYTNDINKGWNGYYKGKLCNLGTYFYYVKYMDSEGAKHTMKNDLELIR